MPGLGEANQTVNRACICTAAIMQNPPLIKNNSVIFLGNLRQTVDTLGHNIENQFDFGSYFYV